MKPIRAFPPVVVLVSLAIAGAILLAIGLPRIPTVACLILGAAALAARFAASVLRLALERRREEQRISCDLRYLGLIRNLRAAARRSLAAQPSNSALHFPERLFISP